MKKITGGVLIPVCSPCDETGRFLPDEFAKTMEDAARQPVDGVYVCGGTGEGLLMRLEERKLACEIAVAAARRRGKLVLTHIGAYSERDALELAEHAAAAGADGISTVPLPDAEPAGLRAYYEAVAAASGLQTVLYYVPDCRLPLSEVLETLELPGVIGIKSSSNDFFFTMQLMAGKPEGKLLFNGKDEYLAPAVIQGADGGIGMWANVFPGAYAGIYRRAAAGDCAGAFALQTRLNALCCIAFRLGLLETFEAILHFQGRWDRVFRSPAPRFDRGFYERFTALAGPLVEELTACGKEETI